MGARSASFQKIPMPQLKYQQKPDHACPIAIASEMLIQQCTDRLWFEVPALQSARLGQDLGGEVSPGIEVEQAAKRLAGRGSIVVLRKLPKGLRPFARIGYEVICKQAALAVHGRQERQAI